MESFLRSSEVQRLFVKQLVEGTLAEAQQSRLRSAAVAQLIERELMPLLQDQREDLLDRLAEALLDDAHGDFQQARTAAATSLEEVQHLLVNHAEALH
jgi:hypothetical protein